MYYVFVEEGVEGTLFYSLKCDQTEHELVIFDCDPDDPDGLLWFEAEFKCLEVLNYINGGREPDWLGDYYEKNRSLYQQKVT